MLLTRVNLEHAGEQNSASDKAPPMMNAVLCAVQVMRLHSAQRSLPAHISPAVELSVPVEVSLSVPQRHSTLVAALHFVSEHATVAALECSFALHPDVLAMLLRVLSAQPKGVSKLRLAGTRCELDEGSARSLAAVFGGSPGLRKLFLTRFWGAQVPPRSIVQALEGCKKLGCGAPTAAVTCAVRCALCAATRFAASSTAIATACSGASVRTFGSGRPVGF